MSKSLVLIIGLLWATLLLVSWSGPAQSTAAASAASVSTIQPR